MAPNFNLEVVAEATRLQLVSLPGVMTPTEAFGAMEAGATGLKLFPAEMASPSVVKALLAVLPPGTKLIPVGGISAGNILVEIVIAFVGAVILLLIFRAVTSRGRVRT